MKMIQLCQAMAWLALLPPPASAVDLTKIDRTISKEPAYQTKTPKYALLVFGPDAKHRVWLVLDGDTLHIDKNGNGDLTEEGEQVKAPAFSPSTHPAHERERSIAVGDIAIDGLTHTELTVSLTQYRRKVDVSKDVGGTTPEEWQAYLDSIWRQAPDGLIYMVSVNLDPKCYGLFGDPKGRRVLHFAWIDRHGQLAFADRPKDAPIIHFGGLLTLRTNPSEKLRRGKNPGQTTLCLGTAGLGPGTFVTMGFDLVPKDVHPTVDVQFPARGPGQPPIRRKYVLKERC
jgi:hypothetical protein